MLSELGAFQIIEYQRDLSVSPSSAVTAYFSAQMNVKKRQLVCHLHKSHVTIQAGAMQWMLGNVNATTGIKGVGDFLGKAVRGKASGESAIKPEYTGDGLLVLEPTYKHLILMDAADWGGSVVLDDGPKNLPCAINVVTDEPGRTVMEMTLKEGKNREIRRMCEAVGLEVVRLKRNAEGVVKLGMLKPGTYRELTKAEINGLRSAAAKGRAQTRSAALQSKAAERRPRGPVGKSAPKKRK